MHPCLLALAALAGSALAHIDPPINRTLYPDYDPTACWPIDNAAALPAKCRAPEWSLDLPCPKCWKNPNDDYVAGAPVEPSTELKQLMKARLDAYVSYMLQERPAGTEKVLGGTMNSGVGGRALLLLKLYEVSKNATYLELAGPYVAEMEGMIAAQRADDAASGFRAFQLSHTGMVCISALYADYRGDAATVRRRVQEILDVVVDAATNFNGFDDFLSGKAGLLYAARFLEKNIAPRGVAKIAQVHLDRVMHAMIDRGVATGRAEGHAFMQWKGLIHGGLFLGHTHGAAGILTQLLEHPEFINGNATVRGYMKKTLDHLVASQFPSGNFPSAYYREDEDVLVQWDHGAPGVAPALLGGWRVFGDAAYLASAEKALDCTWRRGIIFKGLMNCHGIGGNVYMFIYAAQLTQNPKYAYRAVAFEDTVVRADILSNLKMMRVVQPEPDTEWETWSGSYESAIMLWADLVYRSVATASEVGFMPGL